MNEPKSELRDLILDKLTDGMTAEQAADAVLTLFYDVEATWRDIVRLEAGRDRFMHQRFLVAEVPMEAVDQA